MTPFGTAAEYGRPVFSRFRASSKLTPLATTSATFLAASCVVRASQKARKAASTSLAAPRAGVHAANASRTIDRADASREVLFMPGNDTIGTNKHISGHTACLFAYVVDI